jgi:hypothetical protein
MLRTRIGVVLIVFLVLTQYVPSYYNGWLFNEFVQQASERAGATTHLKDTIMERAKSYSLPVNESDIVITKNGSVYRVSVDYAVPVNLLVYSPEIKFHVVAGGLLRK